MASAEDEEKGPDPEYQAGVMSDDNSLDPSEFESSQDEHFVDEDENFDVVNVVDNRRQLMTRRNKIIVASIMLGLAITLGLVFSGGKKSNSTTTPAVALEEPPVDLDSTCSLKALADDGKEACLQDCERAECCDFPANLPLSCLEGNQQKCLVYHAACSNLNAHSYDQSSIPSSVPPAPSNLGELCTSTSLKTVDGFTGCHEACKHAECCYEEGVGTCTHDDCAGYAPCLTLAATDHVHQDIPAVVNKVCATDRLSSMEGRAECRQACSHALCCFSPHSTNEQETSCLHQDTSFCSQYEKCNDLETLEAVEATPEEIQLSCQDDEDVPGHISLCELVCQRGACCFSDIGCDQVASDIQCSDYEPCEKVFIGSHEPFDNVDDGFGNSDGGDFVDKGAIDAACETNMVVEVVQVPDQPSLCEEVCMPGACCFEKNVQCDVTDPERFCVNYSACSKLHPDEDEENENPPVDEQALKEACQKDDLDECESLCRQGICCFEGDVCDVPHPERYCAHFGMCDVLDEDDDFVDFGGDDEEQDDDVEDDDVVDDDVVEDDDIVDDDALDDDSVDEDDAADFQEITGGIQGEDADESWVDQVGNNGNGGQGGSDGSKQTEIIEITDIHGSIGGADALREACTSDSVTCKTLCKQGACCFMDGGCSVEDPELYCAAFAVCRPFHESTGDKHSTQEDENVDEGWVDALGGGEQGGGGNSGGDTEIVEIMDVDGKIVGEEALHTACTTGSVKCETLCKQGACCFNGDCTVPNPERFCLAFGVCEKYYQGE